MFFILLTILTVLIFAVIILFSFPQFSPIPYFPTNNKDLELIVKTLKLKNNQALFDLGAGDGTVIFAAANEARKLKLNTLFVAVEMNPVLVFILQIKKLFNSNRKNIKIVWSDMFKVNLKDIAGKKESLFYLYVSPKFLEKIYSFIKKSIPNSSIVSYMYPIKSAKKIYSKTTGKNFVYRYN